MKTIEQIAKKYDWIQTHEDDDIVFVDTVGFCLDLQTSFQNSVCTMEEIAESVYTFFNDTESNAVVTGLNEGQFNFGEEQNQFLINLMSNWIERGFYDLREMNSFIQSKQVLGNLIRLKYTEIDIKKTRVGFYMVMFLISVRLMFAFLYGNSTFWFTVFTTICLIGMSIWLGYHWNRLQKKTELISSEIIN